MKLIIDRSQWLRGEGSDVSCLLRQDNKMCCVGFYCLAVGFARDQILGMRTYFGAREYAFVGPEHASFDMASLYYTNDCRSLSEEQREERIREGFKKLGVDVEFVDELPTSPKEQLIEESDDYGLAELACGHVGFAAEAREDGVCVNCVEEAKEVSLEGVPVLR